MLECHALPIANVSNMISDSTFIMTPLLAKKVIVLGGDIPAVKKINFVSAESTSLKMTTLA